VPSAGRLHPLPRAWQMDVPEQGERHGGGGAVPETPHARLSRRVGRRGTEASCAVGPADEILGSWVVFFHTPSGSVADLSGVGIDWGVDKL